jgi:hypothetical protein
MYPCEMKKGQYLEETIILSFVKKNYNGETLSTGAVNRR